MKVVSALGTKDLENEERESRIQYFNELFKTLFEKQEIVQEVIIDDVSYREAYNEVLLNKTMDIKHIEIKTMHESVLMNEIAADLQQYLPKLVQACDSISNLLYGEMKEEEWKYFGQLLEGMQWVGQSAYALHTYTERLDHKPAMHAGLQHFLNQYETQVQELDSAMNHQDYTAAGDIIKYELAELFKHLQKDLEAVVIS